ncbi:hypothetical protein JCM3766R1_002781 [Sporobolomyces carnicolor]
MDLPTVSAPRPVYFVNPISSPPISSPSSPHSTAPPSPSAIEHEPFEYPASSYPPSSAPASRSSSKNPLFKKELNRSRRRNASDNLGWSWISNLFSSEKPLRSEDVELEESRGRRRRSGSVSKDALDTQSVSGSGPAKSRRWFTKEKSRLAVSFAMIALVGANDSSTAASLESMQAYYDVSYQKISTAFLASTGGYFISSISASFLLHHIGFKRTLIVASVAMALGCIALSFAPPFPAFIVGLMSMGFGSGVFDTTCSIYVSHFESQAMMSCMYAFFGIGAMFAPIIIGVFVDKGIMWSKYYYAPLTLSITLAILGYIAFKDYVEPNEETHDVPATLGGDATEGTVIHARATTSASQRMKRALRIRAVWLGFFMIMLAFASSDTLSAWIVSFMVKKRGSPEAASRYQLAGLWGGIALGRVVLAFALGNRMGERSFAVTMLVAACVFLAVIWAVHNFIVNAVAAVLVGFFFGPVTPAVLTAIGRRVPPSLKSSVMSLTIGLGLVGAGCAPLLFGIIAADRHLAALPGTLIVMCLVWAGGWCLLPKNRRRED